MSGKSALSLSEMGIYTQQYGTEQHSSVDEGIIPEVIRCPSIQINEYTPSLFSLFSLSLPNCLLLILEAEDTKDQYKEYLTSTIRTLVLQSFFIIVRKTEVSPDR